MTPNEQLGLALSCLCCLLPFLAGFGLAWLIRIPIKNRGLAGLLPEKLYARLQHLWTWLNEPTDEEK